MKAFNKEHNLVEDLKFEAWLKDYMPDWECEYSGKILELRDAYQAGHFDCVMQITKGQL